MPRYLQPRARLTQPEDESIRLIPLTKNQVAIVDAGDYAWLSKWNWHAAKRSAGFYAATHLSREKYVLMHSFILGKSGVDHRNLDTLDNRRSNLRVCTKGQNAANRPITSRNSVGLKGVQRIKSTGKYKAQIRVAGKTRNLGHFDSPHEAYAIYCRELELAYGEFARFK